MTVKDLKEMLKGKDDDKDVVFISGSGIAWDINPNAVENPKDKDKEKQIVIYIK